MPGLVQYMEITMREVVFGDANPYVANKPVKVLFTYLLIYLFTYLLIYSTTGSSHKVTHLF